MGLIERWGSGTTRMASELESEGFPQPKFESASGRFSVTFFKQLITKHPIIKQGLSERQLLALEYVKEHGSISYTEYQNVTGVSRRTALRDLNDLKLMGILISIGEAGRGAEYRLNAL